MRLRKRPWVAEAILEFTDFVMPGDNPPGEERKGRWAEAFGRAAPLMIELGTGKGDFISQIAEREPGVNFIGIETQQDVLYTAAKKVREKALPNVRLLVFDAARIDTIFAPGEAARIYINFCDPWPKKRHAKRRLTSRAFLDRYRVILARGGEIHFKTDNRPLFDFSLEEFAAAGLAVSEVSYDLHADGLPGNIETEYERKFSGLGEKINRCVVTFPGKEQESGQRARAEILDQ